ncbi:MAG: aminoglycoside phosphotransferase family protein [Fimbriimonadaceae bacterium]
MKAPTADEIATLLAKYGMHGDVRPLRDGYINWVFAVGGAHVLRINKPHRGEEDSYTEAVAVPAAVAAGIRTPKLIAFDDSRSEIPYVYTIYERAEGVALAEVRADQRELPVLYRELGAEIANCHTRITVVEDPNGWLDKPYFCDPRTELETARSELKIELVTYDWIAKWNERLAPAIEAEGETVFVHNDLHAGNTMVTEGPLRLSALIDWGDACWGDPALDMERVPIWATPWLLEAYHGATGSVDDVFVGRVLAHVLGTTLYKACDPEFDPTDQPWHPFPNAFAFNLVRLMRMELPPEWHDWLPDAPI